MLVELRHIFFALSIEVGYEFSLNLVLAIARLKGEFWKPHNPFLTRRSSTSRLPGKFPNGSVCQNVFPIRSARLLPSTRDLYSDSTEASRNLLKLRVTDGFFWRSKVPLATVIGPLSDPRPLPYKPLPFR